MLIMSISIIGIYTLVNSAQKLAKTADDRLIATNLAKEWLESIGALRDTFLLRAYQVEGCFFSIDISNGDTSKCPEADENYFLKDNKTLTTTGSADICIETNGWHSQELSREWTTCVDTPRCWGILQKECRTPFSRTITFTSCEGGLDECVEAQVDVKWGESPDKELSLKQIFTRH